MLILGINAYHGSASAALLCDGVLIAAAEEERFNRVKYCAGFPAQAVSYCLQAAGVGINEVDHIAVPRDPYARLATKIWFGLQLPRFAADRSRLMVRMASLSDLLGDTFDVDPNAIRAKIHRVEHHRAHIASAFFVSPFEDAAVLSADGLGDFASTMWGLGVGGRIHVNGEIRFPHSLGMYYTAVTQYLGFNQFGDEYKVMGLAAYGRPTYLKEFQQIVRTNGGFGFRLGLEYFRHHRHGPQITWRDSSTPPEQGRLFSDALESRLGPARPAGSGIEEHHRDVAASLQERLEEVYLSLLRDLYSRTKTPRLCLAGGVAFNCVANGKITSYTPFESVFVPPAAGDAGLAVGAAYYVYHQVFGYPRNFVMNHANWGPAFNGAPQSDPLIQRHRSNGAVTVERLADEMLIDRTAEHIADGAVVGWYQGRMEWGPRALGNRSILVDPRRGEMKRLLNLRIKRRESFRPFAPSVLEEVASEYFESALPSPFMTFACKVRPSKVRSIPAVVHADGTARLHTAARDANPLYWRLIQRFGEKTGIPVLLNTSFNDNEPIVCRPEEAIDCFFRANLDVLVIGNYLIQRKPRPGLRSEPPRDE